MADSLVTSLAKLIVRLLHEAAVPQDGKSSLLAASKLVDEWTRALQFRIGLGPLGRVEVSLISPLSRESIDARLAMIESARESLSSALRAMDELKITAENNRSDLDKLTAAIAKAEEEKADLNAQLEAVRQLAAIDSNIVRETLRIPTEVDKWRERIWGFIFGGVIAGLVATAIWEFGVRPYFQDHPTVLNGSEITQPEIK
jgi:hypothetical protein